MSHLKTIILGSCFLFTCLFFVGKYTSVGSAAFMPHGHCYYWTPYMLYTNILTNALIGISYFAIPVIIYKFSKSSNVSRYKVFFVLFSSFILSCGIGHFITVLDIFYATYDLAAVLSIITATLSVVTALALLAVIPVIMKDLDTETLFKRSLWEVKAQLFSSPFFVHQNGQLIYVNQPFKDKFGYEIEEINDMTNGMLDLLDPISKAKVAMMHSRGEVHQVVQVVYAKDGTAYHMKSKAAQVKLDSGYGRAVVLTDYTEHVRLKDALNKGIGLVDVVKEIVRNNA